MIWLIKNVILGYENRMNLMPREILWYYLEIFRKKSALFIIKLDGNKEFTRGMLILYGQNIMGDIILDTLMINVCYFESPKTTSYQQEHS